MAVGPSAPPIMPIEAAASAGKASAKQPINVTNIPTCAAAPKSSDYGLAISGSKSVIAPIPINIRQG